MVHKQLKHLAISSKIWKNHAWRDLQPIRKFRQLEKFPLSSIDYHIFAFFDTLDIPHRDSRESEVKEMLADGDEELKWLALGHHRKWNVPELDFKIRLGREWR